ncbi:hypothetical protein VULLAG_LOCUS9061 [Vulpes lagopus]
MFVLRPTDARTSGPEAPGGSCQGLLLSTCGSLRGRGGPAGSPSRSPADAQALPLLVDARELLPLQGDPGSPEPGGRAAPGRQAARPGTLRGRRAGGGGEAPRRPHPCLLQSEHLLSARGPGRGQASASPFTTNPLALLAGPGPTGTHTPRPRGRLC